jgi:alcohol dehydrogenase class IV
MSLHGVSYGPRTISAAGALERLGAEAKAFAGANASVLLVADSGLRPLGLIGRATASMEAAALTVATYDEIAGEPKESQVEAARRLGKSAKVKAVVCLGGGSALDAGKLAAVMLGTDAPVSDFRLAVRGLPQKTVPFICIPTTAGTGSEMTGTSVISDEHKTKFWFWGDELKADLAVLDPELTVGLPPKFTAMTGMDALVHAIESATNRFAGPESDVAALEAIRLVTKNLPLAIREPKNISARTAMLEAAALGGLAISKSGTALAHNIGHALGSLAPVPHGLAVTLAMAATAEWVVEGNREGFARVAEAMGEGADPDTVPDVFRSLARTAGLDLNAAAAAPGLTAEKLAHAMAQPENASMRKSTKRLVADEDLLPLARMTIALGKRNLLPEGEGSRGAAG